MIGKRVRVKYEDEGDFEGTISRPGREAHAFHIIWQGETEEDADAIKLHPSRMGCSARFVSPQAGIAHPLLIA